MLQSIINKSSADSTHILRSHVLTLLPAAVYSDIPLGPKAMSVMLISPGGQLIGRQDWLLNRALPLPEKPAELQKQNKMTLYALMLLPGYSISLTKTL